jgi:hypothetical protein
MFSPLQQAFEKEWLSDRFGFNPTRTRPFKLAAETQSENRLLVPEQLFWMVPNLQTIRSSLLRLSRRLARDSHPNSTSLRGLFFLRQTVYPF